MAHLDITALCLDPMIEEDSKDVEKKGIDEPMMTSGVQMRLDLGNERAERERGGERARGAPNFFLVSKKRRRLAEQSRTNTLLRRDLREETGLDFAATFPRLHPSLETLFLSGIRTRWTGECHYGIVTSRIRHPR